MGFIPVRAKRLKQSQRLLGILPGALKLTHAKLKRGVQGQNPPQAAALLRQVAALCRGSKVRQRTAGQVNTFRISPLGNGYKLTDAL
jgi:hypothetical protein